MRLIDADALLKEYDGAEYEINSSAYAKGCNDVVKWSRKTINEQPTIDAVPVVHGKWIESPDNDGMDYECSNLKCKCRISYNGSRVSGDFNYCPNCGAKMDGERRDDG